MKSRPILFSAPMIRAILSGAKSQTRRVVTTREPLQFIGGRGEEADPSKWGWFFDGPDHHGYMVLGRGYDERHDHGCISIPCPYGDPGDQLWVRETWQALHQWIDPETGYADDISAAPSIPKDSQDGWWTPGYAADDGWDPTTDDRGFPWRPGIHMPRWASRITLEVTEVRVQRLQEISEDDAREEGVDEIKAKVPTARDAFRMLWDDINGERRIAVPKPWPATGKTSEIDTSASWASNPWVWAIGFRRTPQP